MSAPIVVDLPHNLGAAEAKRRIAGNLDTLAGRLPGGAEVSSAWDGDRLKLDVGALGQRIDARLDIQDRLVRVTVLLPPALAFFGGAIEAALRRSGSALLADGTKR
ncbi:MAG TPA: polyhydroxyalkanoic acid system family protein [Allosphingosinicella sp.]|nr:polyhydroxyalkanoic acid system family protein [Allosphingosinicella sp.]